MSLGIVYSLVVLNHCLEDSVNYCLQNPHQIRANKPRADQLRLEKRLKQNHPLQVSLTSLELVIQKRSYKKGR